FVEIETGRVQHYISCGAELIWIEECMTDMISPSAFERFNLPYLKKLIDAIRVAGGKSIYYYCGNPWDRMDKILQAGADAIAFEEGKKNFQIDIEKVVDVVDGRCTVFGNLDAINLLPHAEERQLKQEIKRQLKAGVKNKRKFVMSLGSPVTPETSVERVRLYCDLSRKIREKI
ncbi:MAG: uroporphyrinogen decarboxylase family protein, partial [Candidatus Ratteibacteria bacterium]